MQRSVYAFATVEYINGAACCALAALRTWHGEASSASEVLVMALSQAGWVAVLLSDRALFTLSPRGMRAAWSWSASAVTCGVTSLGLLATFDTRPMSLSVYVMAAAVQLCFAGLSYVRSDARPVDESVA